MDKGFSFSPDRKDFLSHAYLISQAISTPLETLCASVQNFAYLTNKLVDTRIVDFWRHYLTNKK